MAFLSYAKTGSKTNTAHKAIRSKKCLAALQT